MLFFKKAKRNKLFKHLKCAFPQELEADVRAVCNVMHTKSAAYDGALFDYLDIDWQLLSGETVLMPYRIYVSDVLDGNVVLTEVQRLIYHCIFTRSYDGYVRRRHVEALLDSYTPDFAMPYVLKLCDEYVKEIQEAVYDRLKDRNCSKYKELCQLNFEYFKLGHSRMISYWNDRHRYDCYRYKDHIGKRLYKECFGYSKTGQKAIRF